MEIHKGDNVNRDKIKEQINAATYIKHQTNINYGEKKIPAYLTMPPMNTQVFEGREKALQEVHDTLFGGNNLLMLVNGQGGIGKTTFAAKYWLQYEHKYTHLGVLYVGNGIANELLRLAPTLQVSFPNEMPDNQRLEVLFTEVTALNKPCLLILDNANNGEDLGKYAVALSKCINFHILLTSRLENFAMAKTFPLPHLDKTAALKVFQQNYTYYETTDETLFYEIFSAVGGNTLVMELLAKNLNNFNRNKPNYSLQNLHEDLKKSLLNLSKSKEVHTAYQAQGTGLRNEKPEVIILAMYDLSELSEAEIALLSAFAVLPPENIAFLSLETLLKSETLEDSLEKLTQKGWIEFDKATKSYKVSPVVQEITRYKNKERLFRDCEGMIINILENIGIVNLKYNFISKIPLYIHYSPSIAESIYPYVNSNNSKEIYSNLCNRMAAVFVNYGQYAISLRYALKSCEIMENLGQINTIGYFNECLNVSVLFHDNYNFTKGLEYALKAGKVSNSIEIDGLELARLHNHTAINLMNLEKLQDSLKHFLEAAHIREQLLKPDDIDLAISYNNLGNVYMNMREYNLSLNYHKKALEIREKVLSPNDPDLAQSYGNIGEVYMFQDNIEQANFYFEKDIIILKSISENHPDLAVSYKDLVILNINNKEQATKYINNAIMIYEKNFDKDISIHSDLFMIKAIIDNL